MEAIEEQRLRAWAENFLCLLMQGADDSVWSVWQEASYSDTIYILDKTQNSFQVKQPLVHRVEGELSGYGLSIMRTQIINGKNVVSKTGFGFSELPDEKQTIALVLRVISETDRKEQNG